MEHVARARDLRQVNVGKGLSEGVGHEEKLATAGVVAILACGLSSRAVLARAKAGRAG